MCAVLLYTDCSIDGISDLFPLGCLILCYFAFVILSVALDPQSAFAELKASLKESLLKSSGARSDESSSEDEEDDNEATYIGVNSAE